MILRKQYDNILIGGSGFIGAALIDLLYKKNETVISISRDHHAASQGIDTLVLNVGDLKALKENLPQGKNVFILIGQNSDTFDPDQELRNITNLIQVFNKTLPKKVFYFSSALVYGERNTPAQESTVLTPIDAYSRFKCAAEETLKKDLNPNIALGILRLANVYGNPRNRGFINFLMRRLFTQDDERISINGDGAQERDYMFIDDVASAIIAVRDGLSDRDTVNIATGKSHSLVQLVESISTVTQGRLPYTLNGKKLTEVIASKISNQKLRDEYNFFPKYSFEDGLSETFKRYKTVERVLEEQRILLLGGEGFIGRNLSTYFSREYTCASVGKEQSIFPRIQDTFIKADPYENAISGDYTVVVHLIDHKVPISLLLQQEDMLTKKIHLHERTHVILFSSSVVYANPDSEYGTRKRLLEQFYTDYCAKEGIPLTILRLFNTFGSYQFPYRPGSLISNLIYNYLNHASTEIKDIHTQRDFIYSQDISKFVEYVIQRKLEGTFDVGSGVLVSIQQLISILEDTVLHDRLEIINQNITEHIVCPPARREVFESIQVTELRDALEQTVTFYKDNLHIIKKYVEQSEH